MFFALGRSPGGGEGGGRKKFEYRSLENKTLTIELVHLYYLNNAGTLHGTELLI